MVGVIKQLRASNSLPGGVLNHEHIFQPIYQMLLAIHTSVLCCLSPTVKVPHLMPLLQKAAEALSEVALHPVLAAMLTNTMAAWNAAESDTMHKVDQAYFHASLDKTVLV